MCGKTEGEPAGHDWIDATCEEPKTCFMCGKTEGEPAGHDWVDATCETPKTCAVCKQTSGDPLGHNFENGVCTVCEKAACDENGHKWVDATCEEPQTCSVCGKTDGEPAGHDWNAATCETPRTCSVCGKTEGDPMGHSWDDATCEKSKTCSLCGKTEGKPVNHAYKGGICVYCGAAEAVQRRLCRMEERYSYSDSVMYTDLVFDDNLLRQISRYYDSSDTPSTVCKFLYDEMGRFVGTEINGVQQEVYRYDQNGNLIYERDTWGDMVFITEHVYDSNGGILYTVEYMPDFPEDKEITDYVLDDQNRIVKAVSNGSESYYFYDDQGRLDHIKNGKSGTIDYYRYDAQNRVAKVETHYKSGMVTWQAYDYENYKPFVACYDHNGEFAVAALMIKDSAGHNVWGIEEDWAMYDDLRITSDEFGYVDRLVCDLFEIVFLYEEGVGSEPELPEVLLGDVDGDEVVTYLDAMETLRAAVGLVTLDDAAFAAADVDHDNEITYLDAMEILRAAVGLVTLK